MLLEKDGITIEKSHPVEIKRYKNMGFEEVTGEDAVAAQEAMDSADWAEKEKQARLNPEGSDLPHTSEPSRQVIVPNVNRSPGAVVEKGVATGVQGAQVPGGTQTTVAPVAKSETARAESSKSVANDQVTSKTKTTKSTAKGTKTTKGVS